MIIIYKVFQVNLQSSACFFIVIDLIDMNFPFILVALRTFF